MDKEIEEYINKIIEKKGLILQKNLLSEINNINKKIKSLDDQLYQLATAMEEHSTLFEMIVPPKSEYL